MQNLGLWSSVEHYIERSIHISTKTWSMVVEFLNKRVGHLIFGEHDYINRTSPPNDLSFVIQ